MADEYKHTCELCKCKTKDNGSSLRGLTLCGPCDRGLNGGEFAAKLKQDEHRSAKRGIMLCDRSPLPKYARDIFAGDVPSGLPARSRKPARRCEPIQPAEDDDWRTAARRIACAAYV